MPDPGAAGSGAPALPRGRVRRLRCAAGWAVAAVAAWWLFWNPVESETLLRALPARSEVVAFVRNVAGQEKALLSNPAFEEAVRAFGEDPDDLREENGGVYATLFWLTGPRSALSLVPEPGECGGLGWYLAGASAVGWKTKALEFLWRVKYVPFLGPLKTADDGTRYMEFRGKGFIPQNGIVLGLDIVDGVLVAVLAQDPTRVREVADRVRNADDSDAAPCLRAGNSPGWCKPARRHRLWASLGDSRAVLDLGPLGGPGLEFSAATDVFGPLPATLPLSETAPEMADSLAVPQDGTFLFAAGDVSPVADFLSPLFPLGTGGGAVWASAGPYSGRVSIVEAPSLRATLPLDAGHAADGRWIENAKAEIESATSFLKPRWRTAADGSVLLHFKNLKTNLFGETPDSDCAWMRAARGGARVEFGTHSGSAAAQDADARKDGTEVAQTLRGVLAEAVSENPDAAAVARIDFAALSDVARQTGALLALARRFGLSMDEAEAETTAYVLAGLVASRGLGTASLALLPGEPSGDSDLREARLEFRASGIADAGDGSAVAD